ncbi:Undecaprenyl phosphate N,N'-diacetylbacillosamine 1-phosphate transferase [Dyadobacter sp. CECT 9275]|uniref:Undecaprenyl phosphate N,N'-diacetylbacillosamine 1-phosphate transferase n=1 Tax=Dyadobacter helix TaxID=2822344 RepID=A0A916JFQ5_9BACT|nr:sugar transferase [Dyadobacter sp. CECT 9275]CAG5008966.1 Undecaprenyl phosphate N,N'-diacetylbacillosamine 1-phosphate transferase [Dyadobacter sp. CECT 9275]
MYRRFGKRLIDIMIAVTVLVLLLPFLTIITILLSISNNGKPFFVQLRPGAGEKLFTLVKFKTMNDQSDASGNLLPDHERVTRLGHFIRKTSIDELPQLWNVICGQMSLIGPRPLLPEYLPLYNTRQRLRHSVRPGITGLAQINGRNSISWAEKFELDVWYVENLSLTLDLKIAFLTIFKVIRRDDVNSSELVTMEKFTGS